MIYTFVLLDKANALELRLKLRPTHREYISQVADRIAFAGGLVGDDGETRVGSLLAIDFPSRDAATSWLNDEPFTKAGLYASVQIHAFLNLWPQKAGFPGS
jgi:uncharacterized protein YciI